MDKLTSMSTFVAVAELGSFVQAANKLNISGQLVSKYISQLEDDLSVRLFNRTTRTVKITHEGEACLQYAKQILGSVDDMDNYFHEIDSKAKGLLTVSAPVSFATLHLAQLICDFKSAHPEVGIDLQLNDRKVDVIDEGYDVAFRIGQLKDSSLIAKKLAPVQLQLVASPAYLERHGIPDHPRDLNPHDNLSYSYMDYSQSDNPLLAFLKQYRVNESNISCNNGEILAQAAIAGEGYTLLPTFMIGDSIRHGQLVPILQQYQPEPHGLYMVYPHRQLMTTRLRAFVDFCSDYYGQVPYWDQ